MTLSEQHQLLTLWLALFPLAAVGLVVGAGLGTWTYSDDPRDQTLAFRKRFLLRLSIGVVALLIAVLPTLLLRSFSAGPWPYVGCYAFALFVAFLSGPQDVTLYLQSCTYRSVIGWPFLPSVKTGRFVDFAGIGLTQMRSAVLVTIKVITPKERLLILGSFNGMERAVAFLHQIATTTGLPVMQETLPLRSRDYWQRLVAPGDGE